MNKFDSQQAALAYARSAQPLDPDLGWRREDIEAAFSAGARLKADTLGTFLSIKQTARLTSLSRTMINRHRAAGRFPQAVELGDRRLAFVHTEVEAWIEEKIAARRIVSK